MYAIINDKEQLEVRAEATDACYTCKNINKCPLLQAISKEYVIMHYSDIEVKECALFKR